MMAAVRLGAVITALHAAVKAAVVAAIPTALVVDGPVVSNSTTGVWVFVGANDTPGEPGATAQDGAGQDLPEYVVAPTYSIDVTIQTWAGTTDAPARRDEAEAVLDLIEPVLIPSPAGVVLGLAEVESARVGDITYSPGQIPKGSTVTLVVTVDVQMRVRTR